MAKNRHARNEPQRESAPVETVPTYEEIAALAYRLWQEGGCRDGYADEDWARAERLLREGGERAGGGLASSGEASSVGLATAGGLAS